MTPLVLHSVKIISHGVEGCSVEIDGRPIVGVIRYVVDHAPGAAFPRVCLEFSARELQLDVAPGHIEEHSR